MDNIPELNHWIVTYNSLGLPGLVQGLMITGDSKELNEGVQVQIPDVFSLDLRNKQITTNAGQKWKLIGPGSQSVILSEIEPFGFIRVIDDENPEDEFYDGEEDDYEEN